MEFLSTIILVSCIASPVLLVLTLVLAFLYFTSRMKADAEKKKLEGRIALISRTAMNSVRESWFVDILDHDFASELEVEAKFVYPMLRYLSYKMTDIRMRFPVEVQVGRQPVGGIADWVVFREGKPYLIIEAKEKNQPLNLEVKAQARSYAFALNAPLYMVTNGREIEIWQRGVDVDKVIFQSHVKTLADNWGKFYEIIGVTEVV